MQTLKIEVNAMRKLNVLLITGLLILFLSACSSKPAFLPDSPDNGQNGVQAENYNWLITVDDLASEEQDGVELNYQYILVAFKEGGSSAFGNYKAKCELNFNMDAGALSNILFDVFDGMQMDTGSGDIEFKVEKFDLNVINHYGEYGPKVDAKDRYGFPYPDSVIKTDMALFNPEMSGSGGINLDMTGKLGYDINLDDVLQPVRKAEGSSEMPMRLTIYENNDVSVEIPAIGKTFMGKLQRLPYSDKNPEAKKIIEEELAKRKAEKKKGQESEEDTMSGNPANLNQTPWPEKLVPKLPKASDLVYEVLELEIDAANQYIEIYVYMSKAEAEAYLSGLKDHGISTSGPYSSSGDILLEGEGDGFDLQCAYLAPEQYLRIQYYIKG